MAAYHRVYDLVTCGLTAKKPGSAPCPMLVMEYGNILLYFAFTLAVSLVSNRVNKLRLFSSLRLKEII